MEGLKKLEEIQRMLIFMDSQHFISPTPTSSLSDSHRFLAQFLLFLIEPSGKLSIDDKCSLISQHLPKISPSFLENALVVLPGEQTGGLGDPLSVDLVKEDIGDGSRGSGSNAVCEDMALIGLDAMQRANSTLEDFCRSYFMFHGMDLNRPESIFKYLPVLSFVESYIYQLIYRKYNKAVGCGQAGGLTSRSSWLRPPEGCLKVNTDAAIIGYGVGLGAVIRDDRGRLIAVAVKRYQGDFSVKLAEALAARMGLLLAKSLSLTKVELEGDASAVITAVKQQKVGRST